MYSLLELTLSLSGIMNLIVTIINFPNVLEEIRSSIKNSCKAPVLCYNTLEFQVILSYMMLQKKSD